MTPAARHAAAIALIDQWLSGQAVEAALTQWARASRFAGSGDREAVRDLVFRAVRQRRSLAALGGDSGRGMLLGMARADRAAPEGWTGEGHAPAALTADEAARVADPVPDLPRGVALDCPDWLLPGVDAALGARADAALSLMRDRAPVFIRVNLALTPRDAVQAELAEDGIETAPHPLADTALEVTANPRRLRNARAFAEGRIEMQDAASQAIAADFARHVPRGAAVLDYCAGGGGKALALAALGFALSAHDIDPGRMRDLPARARRAGADITLINGRPGGQWPAIFADAPCSGSGSWRRAPEAKWAFTPDRLAELTRIQDQILKDCAALTAPGGVLGYATCSLLTEENDARIDAFLAGHTGWRCVERRHLTPLDGGDGFFVAILRRD